MLQLVSEGVVGHSGTELPEERQRQEVQAPHHEQQQLWHEQSMAADVLLHSACKHAHAWGVIGGIKCAAMWGDAWQLVAGSSSAVAPLRRMVPTDHQHV